MKRKRSDRVLLYYKYTTIEDPEFYTERHLKFCLNLGIKGRILVAKEGINGTVAGTFEQTEAYMQAVKMDARFSDMEFKTDDVAEIPFKKMFVRVRDEIVTYGLKEDIDPNQLTGTKLKPKQFYEMLKKDDVVIIDGRNDYEYDLGHFEGAIRPTVNNAKEFQSWIRKDLDGLKDKTVLTYCTGGIRCEKLSGLLLREGFKNVFQLNGGIINYSHDKEVKGKGFLGKCYVFDERISVDINHAEEHTIVAKCFHCGEPSERYVNCARHECHVQIICCEDCDKKFKRSCSVECMNSDRNVYNMIEKETEKIDG